jgi:hypothetical protein
MSHFIYPFKDNEKGGVMRPHAHEAEEQTRLTAYGHIIHRYLRYVLIRCTGYTNDKAQVQRIAVYALVTACLLFDKLSRLGELGWLIEMMVKIAAEDPTPDLPVVGEPERGNGAEPVFVLDGRMCEVAGAINGLGQFERELLVLHHIEGMEVVTLADAHAMSADDIRGALANAEGQFIELLRGLSSWDEGTEPDVHALLVALADCIDLPWANGLGVYALRYVAGWESR